MWVLLLPVDGDQFVLAAAEANLLGVLDGVDAVAALDAFTHRGYIVAHCPIIFATLNFIGVRVPFGVVGRLLLTEDEVDAGLVESYRLLHPRRLPVQFVGVG